MDEFEERLDEILWENSFTVVDPRNTYEEIRVIPVDWIKDAILRTCEKIHEKD